MQEIGRELREAREEKGLTLEDVSSRTMIAKKYLRALEEGRFEAFSGEVYLKGALRKYASELGLDPAPLLARYSPEKPKETVSGNQGAQDSQEKALMKPVFAGGKARRLNKGRLLMFVLILALLVVGIRAVGTIINSEPSVAPDPPPVSEPDEEPPAPVDPDNEEPEPPPVQVERDNNADRVSFTVYNTDTVIAELRFTELCWTKIEVDGAKPQENTFSAGQTHLVTASGLLRIRIGNPPGVTLVINGEPVELPETINAYTFEIRNASAE